MCYHLWLLYDESVQSRSSSETSVYRDAKTQLAIEGESKFEKDIQTNKGEKSWSAMDRQLAGGETREGKILPCESRNMLSTKQGIWFWEQDEQITCFSTLWTSLLWSPASLRHLFWFFSLLRFMLEEMRFGGKCEQSILWTRVFIFIYVLHPVLFFSSSLCLVADRSLVIAPSPAYLTRWADLKRLHTQFIKLNMRTKVFARLLLLRVDDL